MRTYCLVTTAFLMAACSETAPTTPETTPAPSPTSVTLELAHNKTSLSIQEKLDCARNSGVLVAAHRGGPRRGYPENALETIQETYKRGGRVFEIDIAESKDGVLFLLHDTSLDRTTEAEGVARERNWSELDNLRLTANRQITDYTIPSLEETLEWAVDNNAILELDKKRSTSFSKIISAVRDADAENNVILITYSYEQAEEVAKLAPELMMTASVDDPSDLDTLARLGVHRDNLIAWTGTRELNPGLWKDVTRQGVEVAFGTLGRRGERFDDQFWEDDSGEEYNDLVESGVTLIATDYTDKVMRYMSVDDKTIAECGL